MSRYILGAGITGLSAGISTGLPIFEARDHPGGICWSYYKAPETKRKFTDSLVNPQKKYRFEIGGGHWIFGADNMILRFLKKYSEFKNYKRNSAVYLSKKNLYIPYPIQNHLYLFEEKFQKAALNQIKLRQNKRKNISMEKWLLNNFGTDLCDVFFHPFHKLYTAGLYQNIKPQDQYKTPFSQAEITRGIKVRTQNTGYNKEFIYPAEGLDVLVKNMAKDCKINYKKNVTKIDLKKRKVYFFGGEELSYKQLFSTLPLNKMLNICNLECSCVPDPYSSVLVLNIGGKKGRQCPDRHWLYVPDSNSGFYRIGFYSNIDNSFLPDIDNEKVSIYVECSYPGGHQPEKEEKNNYISSVIEELQDWGFISSVETIDSNWIDVAYTWSWINSGWRREAIDKLKQYNIYQLGRYGLWKFQGIADSIRQGINAKIKD